MQVITVALEGLENILRVAQNAGVLDNIVQLVTDCGGITHIEGMSLIYGVEDLSILLLFLTIQENQ